MLALFISCSKDPITEDFKEESHKGTVIGLPNGSDNYYVESIYGKENIQNGLFDSSFMICSFSLHDENFAMKIILNT